MEAPADSHPWQLALVPIGCRGLAWVVMFLAVSGRGWLRFATPRLRQSVETLGERVSGRFATGGCRLAPPKRHSLGSLRTSHDFDYEKSPGRIASGGRSLAAPSATLSAARDEFTRAD